jgi:hypothetical protein
MVATMISSDWPRFSIAATVPEGSARQTFRNDTQK